MRRIDRIVVGVDRRCGLVFAGIGVLSVAAYLVAHTLFPRPHGRILDGDAIQYYAYLRSLVFDGDVDFRNEYAHLYRSAREVEASDNVWLTARTPTGRAPNMMAIGPALLWSPLFLATIALVSGLRLAGASVPLDGFAAPFQLSAGVAGIAYATVGIYLCFRVAARAFSPQAAFWGALVAWLATSAIYYSLVSPAYSHAVSLFAVALVVFAWDRTRDDPRWRRWALLGALGGLAALVRWQDAVVFVLPLVELARGVARRETSFRHAAAALGALASTAALVFSPQLLAWERIYGTPLLLPQGDTFMRWTEPALWAVLVSTRHGLLLWTPAVLLALGGLLLVPRRDATLGWGAIGVFLLSLYINASVSDWWAGEAFGARRFVGDTVLFAVGFAAIFDHRLRERPARLRALAAALILYNLLFLLQYQLFMRGFRELAPYPTTVKQILVDRITLPWRIAREWLAAR